MTERFLYNLAWLYELLPGSFRHIDDPRVPDYIGEDEPIIFTKDSMFYVPGWDDR